MNSENTKQQLIEIVKTLRMYDHWMLEGLSQKEFEWKPVGGRARTIKSLFRHILNAEIYWLKHLGDNSYSYESKTESIDHLFEAFNKIEQHLISLLSNASDDDLMIKNPKFNGDKLQIPGSLAWIVLRTSLHAVHHFGQIAHIRFSMEKPPNPEERKVTWGEAMDVITKVMLL